MQNDPLKLITRIHARHKVNYAHIGIYFLLRIGSFSCIYSCSCYFNGNLRNMELIE